MFLKKINLFVKNNSILSQQDSFFQLRKLQFKKNLALMTVTKENINLILFQTNTMLYLCLWKACPSPKWVIMVAII